MREAGEEEGAGAEGPVGVDGPSLVAELAAVKARVIWQVAPGVRSLVMARPAMGQVEADSVKKVGAPLAVGLARAELKVTVCWPRLVRVTAGLVEVLTPKSSSWGRRRPR